MTLEALWHKAKSPGPVALVANISLLIACNSLGKLNTLNSSVPFWDMGLKT